MNYLHLSQSVKMRTLIRNSECTNANNLYRGMKKIESKIKFEKGKKRKRKRVAKLLAS